jgi:hypothetical protein
VNAAEAGLRAWLDTAGGRAFAAAHGSHAAALAALYAQDAAETDAARALQDEMERTRGRRPDFGEAKKIVHQPAAGVLTGSTEDVAAQLSRDPGWRWTVDAAPRDSRVILPGQQPVTAPWHT